MLNNKVSLSIRLLIVIVIVIDSFVPLLVWPFGSDYFYYPKIMTIYILILAGIVITFFLFRRKRLKLRFTKELIPLAFFLIMIILSTLFSQYKEQAFWGSHLRYEGAAAYAAYFLIAYFSFISINSIEDINIIVKFLLFSAFVISVYAILQYMGVEILPRDEIRKIWTFSSFATLGNPNFLGSYLSIVFPITICLFFYKNNKLTTYILVILNVVIYSALICSRTRSAWIGTAFSLYVLLIIFVKRLIKYKAKILLLLVSFIIATYILNGVHNGLISSKFNSLINDYKTVVNKQEYSTNIGSQRMFIWSRTMKYVFDRPLLGSGPDTFDKVFKMSPQETIYHFGSYNVYVDKAHNEYLQIAVTMGFPALFFYLSFLIIILYKSLYSIIHKNYTIYIVCFFSSTISYITQAFFNISVVSVAPLYWSTLGLLLSAHYLQKERPS